MEQIFTVVIWAAILQGILLGILFLTTKQYKSFSNKLLGLFLLSLMAEAIELFLPFTTIFGYPFNYYFGFPDTKILFSLLFIHYVLEKLGATKKYKKFVRVNYVLAFAIISISFFNILFFITTGQTIRDLFSFEFIETVFLSQQTYAFILSFAGIIIALIETRKYKKLVSNNYSDLDMLSISWLWLFIGLLIPATVLWGAELVRIYIGFYKGEFTSWDFVEAIWGLLIIFIYFVSYQAYKHKDLFDAINAMPLSKTIIDEDDVKQVGELEEPLINCMEEERMFLKSDLTIYDVAKKIDSTTRKVSNCINDCFGYNFSEWVNRYRVEEVKSRFEDNATDFLTIEAIGQESGFKSRSALYTAFTKFTGHSPAKFRKIDLS